MYMLHRATCFDNVARLFPKLAENENGTNTSNLRWVYWANARMRMYGHDVQSINELFLAERNTIQMLQALAETVKSATWRMTVPNATYSTTEAVPSSTDYSHNFTLVLGV